MASDNLGFISYNINEIHQSSKRAKIFEYLKNRFLSNWIVFFFFFLWQETHCSDEDENQWSDNFKGKILYSHGTTNSCGVPITFLGSKPLEVLETKNDDRGIFLLLDIKIYDKELLLVNPYNANTEKGQLHTLTKLSEMLNSIPEIINMNVILAGDFNVFFHTLLEIQGGNRILKKKSLTKIIEIKETLDLCNIWRIRNPKSQCLFYIKTTFLVVFKEDWITF